MREKILIAMIDASLATPESEPLCPAAMPATCVPWSHPCTLAGQGRPEPTAVVSSTAPGHVETALAMLVP